MKISHVRISNLLGIDELEFTPGKFNSITGKNGTGKTSVLESIKAALGRGHDATLLRKGATNGEIVLLLDDGLEITKRVSADASDTVVRMDGKKQARPTDIVRGLADLMSVNPVDFLRATKKDRARVLLESMPLVADTERLASISGVNVIANRGEHALQVIETVRTEVYNDRTGTNRAVKDKEATINQLRAALPDAVAGVEGNEDELMAQIETARVSCNAEIDRVTAKLAGMQSAARTQIDDIRSNAQTAIDAIKDGLSRSEGLAATQREKTMAKFTDAAIPLREAVATIRNDRSAAAKRIATIETIAQMRVEADRLAVDAAAQTKALEGIEAYRNELLASLPIPGLTVIDGEISRDGVVFDRLNTAQQVQIAVEIAKLRAGDLGVICIDDLEALDTETFKAFQVEIENSGLQVFVTRVNDGEFSILPK